MAIKISIIIPVYRVEKVVEKCILSLLNQSLSDIELIVVDDKGGDASMDIVKSLQQTHERGNIIKILEMPINSGASLARNAGMQIASGEYIGFVDSDDWCEPSMFEDLHNAALAENADWAYCQAIKEYPDGKATNLHQIGIEKGLVSEQTRALMLKSFVAYFWTGIYKREFLDKNAISFPAGRYSEDSYFIWLTILMCQRVAFVEKALYHYIQHPSSVSNTYDTSKSQHKIDLYQALYRDVEARNLLEPNKEALNILFLKKAYLIPLFIYISQTKKLDRNVILDINKSFYSLFPKSFSNRYLLSSPILLFLLFAFTVFPLFSAFMVSKLRLYTKVSM